LRATYARLELRVLAATLDRLDKGVVDRAIIRV
jgi:hypothetical protein